MLLGSSLCKGGLLLEGPIFALRWGPVEQHLSYIAGKASLVDFASKP